MTDETGIIILPGGAGLLASEIKKVDQEAERYGIIEDQIVPPRVLVNGTAYEVTSDEEAITERDRIIGEWRAGLRTKPHETAKTAADNLARDASALARTVEIATVREQVQLGALRGIWDMVHGEVPTYLQFLPDGISPMAVAMEVSISLSELREQPAAGSVDPA